MNESSEGGWASTDQYQVMGFSNGRLSAYVFATFLVMGLYVPFLPTWLEGRGLTAEQVGTVFAVALWGRIPVGLALAWTAERIGRRKPVLVLASFTILLGFVAFYFVDGYWALLLGWLVIGTLLTSAIPLTDDLIMTVIGERRADYGQIRLWGSISFIGVSVLGGWYLQGKANEAVLFLLVLASVIMALVSLQIPDIKAPPRATQRPALFVLLADYQFVLFIVTAALLQASHAALYGFATISWKAAGLGEIQIGLLWAEGVALEVLLFMFGRRLMARFRVWQVLFLAALAGVIRWSVLGSTAELEWLVAVQGLHALTFAGTHLAAVLYIARRIPRDHSATAQGLYDGLAMGLMFGIAMLLAGWVYGMQTTDAFYVMAVFSILGGFGALFLGWTQQRSASVTGK